MTARRALVVGTTDGIGQALTRRLLDEGWSVTGVSRRPGDVTHPGYRHVTVDVTAPEYRDALTAAVDAMAVDADGAVDLCVYAAGVGEMFDPSDPAAPAAQTFSIEVNLVGAARTLEVVLPRMVAAGRGHVIGLSSLADRMPSGAAPGYAASKAGLTTYLVGLGRAVRRHGVRITVLRLGFVDTKMAKAPVRPMMIPVAEAVDVVIRCLRSRPAVVSYPRRAVALMAVVRLVDRLVDPLVGRLGGRLGGR